MVYRITDASLVSAFPCTCKRHEDSGESPERISYNPSNLLAELLSLSWLILCEAREV